MGLCVPTIANKFDAWKIILPRGPDVREDFLFRNLSNGPLLPSVNDSSDKCPFAYLQSPFIYVCNRCVVQSVSHGQRTMEIWRAKRGEWLSWNVAVKFPTTGGLCLLILLC